MHGLESLKSINAEAARKNYEKRLIADGCPAPLAFEKSMDYISGKGDKPSQNFIVRDHLAVR